MTDKQIIIDDVDVKQCGFFSKIEGKQTNVCYMMPCHELETEKFIGYLECSENPNCYYKQLQRLKEHHHKTECEASENLKKLVKLEQECEELTSKCSQLKQTLTEIKEIITASMEQNTLINLDKILQK